MVWFYFNRPWPITKYYQVFYLYNLSRFTFLNKNSFEDTVNINYRLPIKVYYRICTLRHIRIEINHGSQNVFWFFTWIDEYYTIFWLDIWLSGIFLSSYTHYKCHFIFQKYILIWPFLIVYTTVEGCHCKTQLRGFLSLFGRISRILRKK